MEEAPSRLLSRYPEPEAFLRFFQPPPETRFYAGVDLHARSLFLAVLDRDGHSRLDLPSRAAGVRLSVGCGSSAAFGARSRACSR
jgi:hypothetical protein